MSTTTIGGVLAIRKGLAKPYRFAHPDGDRSGSASGRKPFAADSTTSFRWPTRRSGVRRWDIFEDNAYEAAKTAGVLDKSLLDQIKPGARAIKPMAGGVRPPLREAARRPEREEGQEQAAILPTSCVEDIRRFKSRERLRSSGHDLVRQHRDLPDGDGGPRQSSRRSKRPSRPDDDSIPSSMIYAYAAIKEGIPYANAAPNLSADIPALLAARPETGTPVAGKDLKTGQTLMKTMIAPGLKARLLGVEGLVLDQHPGQPRRRSARRSRVVQDEGREQEVGPRLHPPARSLPRSLREAVPRRPHQLLSAPRRQQRGLGQHRHLRLARISACS